MKHATGQQWHLTMLTSTYACRMQGDKGMNQSSPPSVPGLDESSSQKLQMAPARLLASPGTSIHASLQDPPGMQMHATSLVVQQLQQEVEELSVSWRCSAGSLLPVPACLPTCCSQELEQLASWAGTSPARQQAGLALHQQAVIHTCCSALPIPLQLILNVTRR